MDHAELARWTRFAAKGGIGLCTATSDCVAENEGDLMFLRGDEITVLMQLDGHVGKYLGYCEGVVGCFSAADVRFHGKLKKPVMTKRASALSRSPTEDEESSPVCSQPAQPINVDGSIDQILSLKNHGQERASMLPPQVTAPLNFQKKPPPPSPSSSSTLPLKPIETSSEPVDQQQEQSYATYETPSTRLSDTYSDDGQVGIGLNMLQALVDDDDDDSSDESHYSTRFPQSPPSAPIAGKPKPSSTPVSPTRTTHDPGLPHQPLAATDKHKPSSTPVSPTRSTHDPGPRAPSLVPSISSGSWEGAIYDDYRYSRHSLASKASRFSSASSTRHSQQQQQQPPPVPDPKPSLPGAGRPSIDSDPVRAPPRRSSTGIRLPPRPPIPLSLQPRAQDLPPAEPSPLLHTNWGSPISSAHEESIKGEDDAADGEDDTIEGPSTFDGQIVVEDDEELPSNILSSSLHDSPSSSPELAFDQDEGEEQDNNEARGGEDSLFAPSPPPDEDPSSAPFSNTSPGTATLTVPSTSDHLRPSLADLRGTPIPGTNVRQSLFLPHPNAPKPPPSSEAAGPMYLQTPQERVKRLSMAFSLLSSGTASPRFPDSPLPPANSPCPSSPTVPPPLPPPGPIRLNSVAVVQLALSKISQQRPPPPGLPNISRTTIYGRIELDLSTSTGPVPIIFSVDPFPATAPPAHYRAPQPQVRDENMARAPPRSASLAVRKPATVPAPGPIRSATEIGAVSTGVGRAATMMDNVTFSTPAPAPAVTTTHVAPPQRGSTSNDPIPRSNFLPKLPGARPRSRSFSAFDTGGGESEGRNRRPDPGDSSVLLGKELKRSSSSHNLKTSNGIPPALAVGAKLSHRPSPLSLPQKAEETERLDSPIITLSTSSSPHTSSGPSPHPQAALRIQTGTGSSSPFTPISPIEPSTEKLRARPSVDTDAASVNSDTRSFLAPSITGRRESLRSKLSLPNLRKHKSKQDETSSLASTPEIDTVQVKDMDFELVRPNLPFLVTRNEDPRKDGLLDPSGLPGSPALSTFSNRSPTVASDSSAWPSPKTDPLLVKQPPAELEQLDAHRQRELKWVSLLSSVPPSQSRKTKKIKKLLLEGVPASVRYLVWTHVTNGRGRIVAGVFPQLCSRGSVAASNIISADIERYFKEHPQLQGAGSPVLTVLQAYLNMVPDVQYTTGLTLIMGQLLLQGPEEEVFWIFVSLMDSYLRPYFSINSIQLEVDATLFSRALEANDPQVAKKMLMEMRIAPEAICASWFTSVFVGTLPTHHVNRVWDIFMYEGIPFLIRVGLALVSCCRRQILECREEKTLLELIKQPPQQILLPHPDLFIALSLNQKVKDDDIRKQRVKMEAQVKRQTQAQAVRKSTVTSTISLPRT